MLISECEKYFSKSIRLIRGHPSKTLMNSLALSEMSGKNLYNKGGIGNEENCDICNYLFIFGIFADREFYYDQFSYGDGDQGEDAKIDMRQLSPSVENWFSQKSGSYKFIFVAKDRKDGTFLYHQGKKPREVADHEHAPALTRIKFYDSGENKWNMKQDPSQAESKFTHFLKKLNGG